jgi:hypothetical protein
MNLVEMRARVREDLQDTDPADYHWTDDEVDGAIQRAVWEYSLAAPIQQQDDLPTTIDDHELDISSLSSLLKVESVEYPTGYYTPYYQRFTYWAGHLRMTDPGDGSDARVQWLKAHTLATGSTTIPGEHEEIIVLGATGYLAMSAAAYTVDRASIAGRFGTMNYREWGKERLARYDAALGALRRKVTRKQLYTEE